MSPSTVPAPARALLGCGQVRHTRLRPRPHAFSYPTHFVLLPLRSLRSQHWNDEALAHNRFGLYAFHDADHGDGRSDCVAWLDELLAAEGITDAGGELWLHCYPRVLGYAFKPVSFWYAHRLDGSLAAVVAEVNNTFGERHCYLLHGPELAFGRELTARKVFHVSPFCAVQGRYRFRFLRTDLVASAGMAAGPPRAPRTVVRIDHDDGDGPLLQTSVSGELQPASTVALRRSFFSAPAMTLAIILRIHWQAVRLWLKQVPFFAKPAPPEPYVARVPSVTRATRG
jgi:uncharacterized protein